MTETFKFYDFDPGAYTNTGEKKEDSNYIRTDFKTFKGNNEYFTYSVTFEPDKTPSNFTDAYTKVHILLRSPAGKIHDYSFRGTALVLTKNEDNSETYALKTDQKIEAVFASDATDSDGQNLGVPNSYAIALYVGNDGQRENLKEFIFSSPYILDMKNEKVIVAGAPDIPDYVYDSPLPEGAWRIDGVYNHGYPYIKRFKDIPYDIRVPGDEPINLMDMIRVVSIPHGVDALFPVTKMSIPLDKPEDTKYTLGTSETKTIVQSTNSTNSELYEKLKEVPKPSSILTSAKNNAANLITQALNGYVTLHQSDSGGCDEIIISSEADYTKAQNVWRWNLGGLGFSNQGYSASGEGWQTAITMDGAIMANMITAGTMFADRIRGGNLILGGYDGVDGVLRVINADKREIVRLDKEGAYVEGEIYNVSQDEVDVDEHKHRYFIREKDGEIIGGITSKIGDPESETIYGTMNARAEINEYNGSTLTETHKGWKLATKAFQIGSSDPSDDLRCENFAINEYKGTSCKVEYVTSVKPEYETVTLKDDTSMKVVKDVKVNTDSISFWYGILNSDTGKDPDEPPKPWET